MAWDPFGDAWDDPRIRLHLASVPTEGGAFGWPCEDGTTVIVIDPDGDGPTRRERLAHELVHVDRGGGAAWVGMPDAWRAVVARDESRVDREAARRQVPPAVLRRYVDGIAASGGGVSAQDVARDFNVTVSVAGLALRAIARKPGR